MEKVFSSFVVYSYDDDECCGVSCFHAVQAKNVLGRRYL